jgi:SAM-dependent methyltransferase
MAESGSVFATVATDEECRDPLACLDGRAWLPASVKGLDVLCLASAGGWQAILYASAGANVTVVDLSPAMLRLDAREAARRNLSVRIVEASMEDLAACVDESFDIVHQPVSTCYVPDVSLVYREVARVLRDGGIYISQHKQPASLQLTHRDAKDRYILGIEYGHEGPLPTVPDKSYREPGTIEYLHSWEALVGGLCRAGLVLEDLSEPMRADRRTAPGDFRHRALYVAPYVRLKARRRSRGIQPRAAQPIWTPA